MAPPSDSPLGTRNTERMILAQRTCKVCGQRFTGDARFCPFDGEPLGEGTRYRAESDPLLGKVIDGRYVIEAVLGEGGMGTVYRTRHKSLGRGFALKAMRADLARETDLAARFTQEAKAAASVHHPNVVEITDFGVLPTGVPYFVMELLEGEPLSRVLCSAGSIEVGRAVRIVRQVAEGLAAAHAAGIVHRDLKPENLHVGPGDAIKILDFGVAKIAGSSRLTRTGKVFGTPHYMSPEQASGQLVDHRADVYALGIIMYEMFTGKVPFESDTFMGVLTQQMFNPPVPPSEVREGRPIGAIEDVILRCLEKNPEHRYANMDALVADLDKVARLGDNGEIDLAPSSLVAGTGARRSGDALSHMDTGSSSSSSLIEVAGLPRPMTSRRALLGVGMGVSVGFIALASWALFGSRAEEHVEIRTGQASAPSASNATARVAASALAASPSGVPSAPSTSQPDVPVPPTPVVVGARTGSGAPKATGHRAAGPGPSSSRAGSGASAGKPPAKAVSGFGSGEIVNPWAQ